MTTLGLDDLFLMRGKCGAILSECERYRYLLWRTIDRDLVDDRENKGTVCFVMLNPSTADADADDPTIRRCMGYADLWGFTRLEVVNVYPYRATDPAALWTAPCSIYGHFHDDHLVEAFDRADLIVCAWGANAVKDDADHVERLIREGNQEPWCLKINKDGSPAHPLYQPKNAVLIQMENPHG